MSIKQKPYHLLRRFTSQRQRDHIKTRISQARGAISPLLRKWYGTYGSSALEAELRARIPADFEILMVHSSISNMQPMYQGSARNLLDVLLRLVGPDRTLAMPAFFFGNSELFNRAYYRKHPRFSVPRTPSQMGLVTELFRRRSGVVRSLHPTHSVCAFGPLASELCATHHLSPWACGELSPFGLMGRRRTTIIGLGVEYARSLTQVHSMEEILGTCFPIPREQEELVKVDLIDQAGNTLKYEMSLPLKRGFILKAERLRDFMEPGDISEWFFHGTRLYMTHALKVDTAIRQAAVHGLTLYDYSPKPIRFL